MKKLLDSLKVSKLPANIHFWVNLFNRRNDRQIEGVSDEKCGLPFDIGFSALRSDGKRLRALLVINLPISLQ